MAITTFIGSEILFLFNTENQITMARSQMGEVMLSRGVRFGTIQSHQLTYYFIQSQVMVIDFNYSACR